MLGLASLRFQDYVQVLSSASIADCNKMALSVAQLLTWYMSVVRIEDFVSNPPKRFVQGLGREVGLCGSEIHSDFSIRRSFCFCSQEELASSAKLPCFWQDEEIVKRIDRCSLNGAKRWIHLAKANDTLLCGFSDEQNGFASCEPLVDEFVCELRARRLIIKLTIEIKKPGNACQVRCRHGPGGNVHMFVVSDLIGMRAMPGTHV